MIMRNFTVLRMFRLASHHATRQEAERQENKLLHSLSGSHEYFEDPTFPPAGESIYRTPQQPPPGALSHSLVFWGRLSRREVRGYESPVTFPPGNGSLSAAVQGALGDSWLVSALNILSLSPDLLRNVVVSDRHRDKGKALLWGFDRKAEPLKFKGAPETKQDPWGPRRPLARDLMQQGGLIAGLGYGILRVCEASAPATPDQDAAKFKMVQLSCQWGIGQWRKAWGNDSDLWEQFPSIKTQLRSRASCTGRHVGSSDDGDGGTLEAGNASFPVDDDTQGEGSSFWMSLEDFVREFSKLFTCLTYAVEPMNKTLSRKTYRGAWSPGDTLTGSGGGCRHASFVQNPCYPVMIQRNSTRITVCLSTLDRSWQVDPDWRGWRSRHHAVGYYILRLKGTKPRVTRFGSHKVAARPERFVLGWQSTGEHVLNSGRYAFIPITVKPLATTTGYVLDITADRSVEWEQVGDAIPPPDRELEVSDDEMDQSTMEDSEEVEAEDTEGPPGDKIAEAMNEELARVSSLIAELRRSIDELGERFKVSRAAKVGRT